MILAGLIGSLVSSGGANYTLTPAANNVNEGSSLTFNVGGYGIVNGTYYWTIETNSSDFTTTNGTVVVTSNSGSFTVTPTADATTDSGEAFTVALRSVSTSGTILVTSSAVTINDTSQTPSYFLNIDGSYSVNEGSAFGFQVGGINAISGTYYWTIETNAGDFATTSGTVSVSGGTGMYLGSFSVTPTADATTEGSETFTVALRSGSITGTILATSDILTTTINDTSLSAPIYTLTPDADNVDEGSSLEFTVGGTDITNGTYYWTVTNSGDFGTTSGEFSITSNSGSFSVTPTADTTTEGSETFTVSIRSGSITGTILQTSESITINDTSLDPEPIYTLTPDADNVDEGSSLEFTVGGTNITNGTYYWTVETSAGDFTTNTGEVSVTDNSGSFTVTPTADTTTEGEETFTVALRSGSVSGSILQTSESITINDTSVPVAPFSLEFVNSENDYVDVAQPSYIALGSAASHAYSGSISSGNIFKGSYPQPQVGWILVGNSGVGPYQVTITGVTDGGTTWNLTWAAKVATNLYMDENFSLYDPALAPFNLSTTWTIEFWLKANAKSETAGGGIWGLLNQGGWSYTDSIVVALSDNKLVFLSVANSANNDVRYVEPTPGVWTHVAISNNAGTQKVFYNGAEQARVSGNVGTASYTNSVNPLRIGRLGPSNGGTLNGKMALVRISDTAKYATAFTPVTTYGVEADTRLFLGTDTPLIGLSTYELNGVSLVTNSATVIYISKSAYPDLDNLIQVGYTVVKTFDQTTSVVTGAVFTADPENWGVNVSPGWAGVATVNFTGTRSEPVTNSGTALSNDVPTTFAPLSLQLVQSETDYLDVAASSDWNLSRNWTIEFWSKAAKASSGGDLLTVMCQDYTDGNSIQILYQNGFQVQGSSVLAAEPTPGVWTHVALVAVEGVMTLYYNGVSQYTGGYWSLNNTTNAIRIGARGTADFQRFDGKLALIRISNTNKYPTAFTATTTYGVEGDTKLFLGKAVPLIDAKGHITTNNGVSTSTGFPQSFTGHLNPYSGGNLGATYSLSGDPNITAFAAIPVGARITSNLTGFGIRLVTGNRAVPAGRLIEYDYTGLDQGLASTTSDTYNFYW